MGDEDREWMERSFTEDELWNVIKHMGSNKAPGMLSLQKSTKNAGTSLKSIS